MLPHDESVGADPAASQCESDGPTLLEGRILVWGHRCPRKVRTRTAMAPLDRPIRLRDGCTGPFAALDRPAPQPAAASRPERQTGRGDMMRDGGSETGIRAALAGLFVLDPSLSVVTQMRGRLTASISSLTP
jgi:hypothetical protein